MYVIAVCSSWLYFKKYGISMHHHCYACVLTAEKNFQEKIRMFEGLRYMTNYY